jgi:hypothetical protein
MVGTVTVPIIRRITVATAMVGMDTGRDFRILAAMAIPTMETTADTTVAGTMGTMAITITVITVMEAFRFRLGSSARASQEAVYESRGSAARKRTRLPLRFLVAIE